MSKPVEREKARFLRSRGKSIKEIAKEIKVSPSSVSSWCRDIYLTFSQKKKLERKSYFSLQKGRKKAARLQRKKRVKEIARLKKKGVIDVGKLTNREIFLVGAALYWAEGFKKDKRLGFANSNPNMIKLFIKWLIEIGKVDKKDLRLRVGLNFSHKYRVSQVEDYWSKLTNIPLSQFQKPFFQRFVWKKRFKNQKKYFGVLRIRANKQRILFRRINGWIEGLRRNSG